MKKERIISPRKKLSHLQRLKVSGLSSRDYCQRHRVARSSLYYWKRKLKEGERPLLALKNGQQGYRPHRKRSNKYYRLATQEQINIVLNLLAKNPDASVRSLFKLLPQIGGKPLIGYHGLQNILYRYGLNHRLGRIIFSQRFIPVELPKPAQFVDTVGIPSLDQLSPQVLPGPPPSRFADLSVEALDQEYSQPQPTPILQPVTSSQHIPSRFSKFKHNVGLICLTLGILSGISFGLLEIYTTLSSVHSAGEFTGLLFSSLALTCGFLFFAYSIKYYISIIFVLLFSRNQVRKSNESTAQPTRSSPLLPDITGIVLDRHPFVSIHLPLYNEKRVVNRLLEAVTSMDYPELDKEGKPIPNTSFFEIVVVDDSTDETKDIVEEWRNHPLIKISHRDNRVGFKGGALKQALSLMDTRTEFILVFDSDFLSYPDTIISFLKYFQVTAGGLDFSSQNTTSGSDLKVRQLANQGLTLTTTDNRIAAIQGYQWHVLNKSENWITRGVRTEYAGSYVIERSGVEIYQGLKQIAGSVFMVRADIMRKPEYQWGSSITEDFELTLKLYRDGYKVVYTPYIQAPSECVSTLKRLIRQRMRWAEGHSHNIRKLFKQMLFGRYVQVDPVDNLGQFQISNIKYQINTNKELDIGYSKQWLPSRLSLSEKLEFLYLSPYYLQSFFFLLGTFSWFISEAVFRVRLPFWTSIWGWSLVLTNLLSLPLMNTVGLFLEEAEEKDYTGIPSFLLLSYILAPFQAYASIKGFLEHEEGPWFRTPKTGKITDIYRRGRVYGWMKQFFGQKPAVQTQPLLLPKYIINPTANHTFTHFHIPKRKMKWVSKLVLTILVFISLTLASLPANVPLTYATNPSSTQWYLRDQNVGGDATTNHGNAIYCLSSTDCKMVYYDVTNGDLKFKDCDDSYCGAGTVTVLDGSTGCSLTGCSTTTDVGAAGAAIYCPAADDCKVSYKDITNGDLLFADCDTATCSSGTRTLLDGNTGCILTNCQTGVNVGQRTGLYCLSSTDCKISYREVTNNDLRMVDCDNATCSAGTTTLLDGGAGCTLTGCSTTEGFEDSQIYCSSATDCKIVYYNNSNGDLRFADCDTATCSTGTATVLDGNTGCSLTGCSTTADVGTSASIYCSATDDCKISYIDNSNSDLLFADCGTTTCSSGTRTLLDGGAGCVLTNCSTNQLSGFSAIYCPGADDCKISYNNALNGAAFLGDCGSSTCGSGTTTQMDGGNTGCVLTGCTVYSATVGKDTSIYCISATDCKVIAYDSTNGDIRFEDCDNAACSSGVSLAADGKQLFNGTTGSVTTTQTFGVFSDNIYTLVSAQSYPTGSDSGTLGTGTYTFHLQFTNNITSGTLTWHYDVGYCTISDNCGTKTVHVTSSDQSFTSGTTSPQNITVTAGSALTIPDPANSKWMYIELHPTAAATGSIDVRMNNTVGNTADSYIDVPAFSVPELLLYLLPLAVVMPKVLTFYTGRRRRHRVSVAMKV